MSDWIDVSVRLPDPSTSVLAFGDCGEMEVALFDGNRWSICCEEYGFGVCYWMHLPGEPEEEG